MKTVVNTENKYESTSTVMAWLAEARELIKKYGLENRRIAEKVESIADFGLQRFSTRAYYLHQIKHINEFFEAWEELNY